MCPPWHICNLVPAPGFAGRKLALGGPLHAEAPPKGPCATRGSHLFSKRKSPRGGDGPLALFGGPKWEMWRGPLRGLSLVCRHEICAKCPSSLFPEGAHCPCLACLGTCHGTHGEFTFGNTRGLLSHLPLAQPFGPGRTLPGPKQAFQGNKLEPKGLKPALPPCCARGQKLVLGGLGACPARRACFAPLQRKGAKQA